MRMPLTDHYKYFEHFKLCISKKVADELGFRSHWQQWWRLVVRWMMMSWQAMGGCWDLDRE